MVLAPQRSELMAVATAVDQWSDREEEVTNPSPSSIDLTYNSLVDSWKS
jgi:hypothetical protein